MAGAWLRTHCARFDHGGCGLRVFVEDGRALAVEPDGADDFSRGYSCPKGMATVERLEHPRRLLHPMKRAGARGAGQWQRITWEEALALLTERFLDIRERHGPEALAFAQGAPKGLEFFMLLRLANLLRCPNVAGSQHVCHMPREQMAMVTCGFFPVADLGSPTACVLLWGSNPLATNEEGVLGAHLMECLRRNPHLIVIDPMKTEAARRADLWLRIRPGTDDLLAMGFLHVLFAEKLFDRDFAHDWTVGMEDLAAAVRPYTPARVAEGTWLPKEQIVAAARLYATSHPALIQWGNALEHTDNSAQTCRALVLLMALTGNLETPGGNVRASAPRLRRLSEFLCLDAFPDRGAKLLNRHFHIIPRLLTVPSWMLVRTILDQSPYPVRCLYTQGTNPLMSYAQTHQVRSALEKLDFLAVADQVLTPTAALADLVLPAATNLEFNDIGHYGLPHGYILARPQLVEARGECWSDLKILNAFGKRLGYGEYFWNEVDEVLEYVLGPSGMTYADLAAQGVLRGRQTPHSYRDKGFATPSGKVELRSSLLAKWHHDPLPFAREVPPLEEPFPLLLTSRKPKVYFHSAYRHLDSLRRRDPRPQVRLHGETARSLGIAEGDAVRIVSAGGAIVQRAHLSDALDPRVVVADFGWWFPEAGEESLFQWAEANLNALTRCDRGHDPVMGTTPLRALPCRLEKAGG
jgi:anaerobic selenocysteine-containing dehydrogenase